MTIASIDGNLRQLLHRRILSLTILPIRRLNDWRTLIKRYVCAWSQAKLPSPVCRYMRWFRHMHLARSAAKIHLKFHKGYHSKVEKSRELRSLCLSGSSTENARDPRSLCKALHNSAISEVAHEEVSSSEQPVWGGRMGETIVALSSGSGRSAVAVIRISGPKAGSATKALLKPGSGLPTPRQASLRNLYDPNSGQLLDKALVLYFPGPASFTGEDVVELHGHGGPAVVRSLLLGLTCQPGVRLAEAGEFTRQAFLGGKLDLTEVEGIADLLAAETSAQHRQALQQTSGVQRKQYERWRKTLLSCLAHVEAVIDFGDDNDIDSGVAQEIFPTVQSLRTELTRHLQDGWRGELLRDGVKVALVGPPNAGKSTLLNRLAGREAAIVSATPGTTRDALEVALDLGGHKVIVTDTAGLRQTEDAIEAEGVFRAQQAARNSNIVVAVADAQEITAPEGLRMEWIPSALDLSEEHGKAKSYTGASAATPSASQEVVPQKVDTSWSRGSQEDFLVDKSASIGPPSSGECQKAILLVINKWDLVLGSTNEGTDPGDAAAASTWLRKHLQDGAQHGKSGLQTLESLEVSPNTLSFSLHPGAAFNGLAQQGVRKIVGLSASTGQGLDLLLEAMQQEIANVTNSQDQAEGFMITRLRHRQHVEECIASLQGYEEVRQQPELASEELRYAARALGKVTGAIDTEDVLDAIFSEFCVGK